MRILGMVSESHDTGVALLEDGKVTAVLEEERHSREKHTKLFPTLALNALFGAYGGSFADIDAITTPWDSRRIRWTFTEAVGRRFPASLALTLPWANSAQAGGVVAISFFMGWDARKHFRGQKIPAIVQVGHHESHAAMFFVSPFEDATVVVMDGYGDDAATSVFTGEGNKLSRRWHGRFFDSLGMLYTFITRHLGFEVFEEGTVMALAALGSDRYVKQMSEIVRLEPEGRFSVDMSWFSYDMFGMMRPFRRKFFDAFGPARKRNEPLTQHHHDLAFALQAVCERVVLHVVQAARKAYPSRNLVMVGGVALNCVANARLVREAGFDRIWVPPCASDTGAPLGSALYHWHHTLDNPRRSELSNAYLGLEYSESEIIAALKARGMSFQRIDDGALIEKVAGDLADGRIVGWYQGRYEIGPRALGNRSILASPVQPGVRDVINARVKFREAFRPFAPSVIEEKASEYFEIGQPDPFMTMAPRVRPAFAPRIPAAVHVDGTARIQTVSKTENAKYHALISAFGERTGVPVLLNTSFNKQEPIVTRPEEAISCFLRTNMDVLVMGNFYTTDRPG
ncbi:MAG: hypothetical protein JSS20_07550, partial [Proteobacteria bacterium]|nr:hypothetical protein [Pseudomonadota bacterium]